MKKNPETAYQEQLEKYPVFFQKVWKECLKIPEGETRTYSWLAAKIGHPGAARAVGQALAKNPFAPYVPCHRVVRADGGMGGYSATGGIVQKRRMLDAEKRASLLKTPDPKSR